MLWKAKLPKVAYRQKGELKRGRHIGVFASNFLRRIMSVGLCLGRTV